MPFDLESAVAVDNSNNQTAIKTVDFDLSSAKDIAGEIRNAPPEILFDKVKNTIKSFWAASEEESIARAQNIYAISKTQNIPMEEVAKNIDSLQRDPRITGIRGELTNEQYESMIFAPLIGAGLVTAPISTAIGLAGFSLLNELYDLKKMLPEDASETTKTVVGLADFVSKGTILGGTFKVGEKYSGVIVDKFLDGLNPTRWFQLSSNQIRALSESKTPILNDLGIQDSHVQVSLNNNVPVKIPDERILEAAKKPYWKEIKDILIESKPSKLSLGVEQKAMEARLTKGFEGLTKYETANMKEQINKANEIINKDPLEAKQIAMGQKNPPGDVRSESVFVAVENKALQEGDVETLRDLATKSTVSKEASIMGQRIRILRERNPESPVLAIEEVAQARAKNIPDAEKMRNVLEKEINKELENTFKQEEKFNEFVKSLSDTQATGLYVPKEKAQAFLDKVKSGDITLEKLSIMTSSDRHKMLSSLVGENNASKVNAMFESKLLLRNQKQGILNWINKVTGLKPSLKRDLISKVGRMEKVLEPSDLQSFLSDLVAQRLGFNVTMEEAGKISELAKVVSDKKSLISEKTPNGSKERIEYGVALVAFKKYVGDLKISNKKESFSDFIRDPGSWITKIAGTTKSIVASMDNSFFGRQGLKTLYTNPEIWMNNFIKSWGDIGKELKGFDALSPIRAEIYSRENSINGKYAALKIDIGLISEEAYPETLPEKIPFFRRLYKASESAYNGAALRMRADLADKLIANAEKMGVDTYDYNSGIGLIVNSMTGRGKVTLTEEQHGFINASLFSIKFLKSNIDTLTAHFFDKNMSSFARKTAGENLLKIVGTVSGILTVAKILDPNSVETDPRSSDFGKILIGDRRQVKLDVTGGTASILTLSARCVPTTHNGKWGFWSRNSKGRYVQLGTGEFGVSSPADYIVNFMEGKTSPVAHVLLDVWKGKTYEGKKPTVGGEIQQLITPISISNIKQLLDSPAGEDPILFSVLSALDMIGFNISIKQKR